MKSTEHLRTVCRCVLLAAWSAVLCGCAGYRVGSTLPPNIKTIYVSTFVNQTTQPDLEFQTTRATLQELQKEGTLAITTQDKADVLLEVKLTHYELAPLQYRKDRATTGLEYRLRLTADVILRRTSSMKVVSSSPNTQGWTTFIVTTDLRSAERDAIPKAAEDLAHEIVKSVVEFW